VGDFVIHLQYSGYYENSHHSSHPGSSRYTSKLGISLRQFHPASHVLYQRLVKHQEHSA
jgi:hypothetical protein